MNLSIYEMLENVQKEKTKPKRIAKLREYGDQKPLLTILDFTFDPGWQWLLPEGAPPYNPSPKEADLQHMLKSEYRKLQYVVNTAQGKAMKPLRRETMFIELLEMIDFNDARLLLAAKEKTLPFKAITKKLVMEAFPEATKGWS